MLDGADVSLSGLPLSGLPRRKADKQASDRHRDLDNLEHLP